MNTAILRATVCDQYPFFRPQSKTLPISGLVKAFTRYGVQTIAAFYIKQIENIYIQVEIYIL